MSVDLHGLIHKTREKLGDWYETGKAHASMTWQRLQAVDSEITEQSKMAYGQVGELVNKSYPFLITGFTTVVAFYPSLKIWGRKTAVRNALVIGTITAVSLYPEYKQVFTRREETNSD